MRRRYLKYIYLLLIITSATGVFAQVDNPMGGLAIPKAKTTVTPSPIPAKTELPSTVVPPTKVYTATDLTKKEEEFSMIKKRGIREQGR